MQNIFTKFCPIFFSETLITIIVITTISLAKEMAVQEMQKQNIHYKWRGKKILGPFDGNNPSRYNEIRIKKDNENISSWIAVKKKSLLTIFFKQVTHCGFTPFPNRQSIGFLFCIFYSLSGRPCIIFLHDFAFLIKKTFFSWHFL